MSSALTIQNMQHQRLGGQAGRAIEQGHRAGHRAFRAFVGDHGDHHLPALLGAAALDLAWVAAGRFDGYWERDLHPWDIAAGILLVTEAGGKVTDADGGEDPLATGSICAANPELHGPLLERLKAAG